jgi:uncharacterized membrane protein YccF (DUF307 family)
MFCFGLAGALGWALKTLSPIVCVSLPVEQGKYQLIRVALTEGFLFFIASFP